MLTAKDFVTMLQGGLYPVDSAMDDPCLVDAFKRGNYPDGNVEKIFKRNAGIRLQVVTELIPSK